MMKELRKTQTIDWQMVDKKEAIGKKIVDVILREDQDGDELIILLHDGKQIEIILHDDGYVHVQTD